MKNNEVYKIALKVSKMGPTWNLFGLVDEAKKAVANYTNSVGVDMIAEERQRQVKVEGWSYMHDDDHDDESLAIAASCYALPDHKNRGEYVDTLWPWSEEYWKPTPKDRIRELVKAGALIVAEIERLKRMEEDVELNFV